MAEVDDLEVVDDDNIDRFPEGMLGSEVNDSARALEGILARWHKDTNGSLVTTGSSNAYTVSPNRTISTYYDGLMIVAEINHDNTGAATLDAGPGARNIRLPDGTALIGGELKTGAKAIFIFDNDNNYWQLVAGRVFSGELAVAGLSSAAAAISLAEDTDNGSNKVTVQAPASLASDYTLTLPPDDGDADQILKTDGSGATDWIDQPVAPIGAIVAWPTATAPANWLECDGSAVSRTTYADLFGVIGETYGNGDGSTTFNLPDLRGEFVRGFDNGATNDPDAASRTDRGDGTTGDNVGTKQGDEFNEHSHFSVKEDSTGSLTTPTTTRPMVDRYSTSGNARYFLTSTGTDPADISPTSNAGGNETRPRNIALMWIMRAL